MATPPVFVAEYETVWNTGGASAKTVSVTVANGDVLVIVGITESDGTTLGTPTGGGLTYTPAQSINVVGFTSLYTWTAPSASAQSFTMSITPGGIGGGFFGYNVLRFSGATIGTSTKTNVTGPSAPSLALTTTQDNSAVVMGCGDWTAADGASRIYRTVNSITPVAAGSGEDSYFRNTTNYATYVAHWSDCGTAGAQTYGLTTPSQRFSIINVEVKGTVAAAPIPDLAMGPMRH